MSPTLLSGSWFSKVFDLWLSWLWLKFLSLFVLPIPTHSRAKDPTVEVNLWNHYFVITASYAARQIDLFLFFYGKRGTKPTQSGGLVLDVEVSKGLFRAQFKARHENKIKTTHFGHCFSTIISCWHLPSPFHLDEDEPSHEATKSELRLTFTCCHLQ